MGRNCVERYCWRNCFSAVRLLDYEWQGRADYPSAIKQKELHREPVLILSPRSTLVCFSKHRKRHLMKWKKRWVENVESWMTNEMIPHGAFIIHKSPGLL
jgi:hypothetical protein